MHETMLAILLDETRQRKGKKLEKREALQMARELEPETYMGMTGLESFNQLWNLYSRPFVEGYLP